MGFNVNCKYNKEGAWCTNLNKGRSLAGLGARCCVQYPYSNKECSLQEEFPKPSPPPEPPRKHRRV